MRCYRETTRNYPNLIRGIDKPWLDGHSRYRDPSVGRQVCLQQAQAADCGHCRPRALLDEPGSEARSHDTGHLVECGSRWGPREDGTGDRGAIMAGTAAPDLCESTGAMPVGWVLHTAAAYNAYIKTNHAVPRVHRSVSGSDGDCNSNRYHYPA